MQRTIGLSLLLIAISSFGQTADPNQPVNPTQPPAQPPQPGPTVPPNPGTGAATTNALRRTGFTRSSTFTPGYTRFTTRVRLMDPRLTRGTNTISGTNAPQRISLRTIRTAPATGSQNVSGNAGGGTGAAPAKPANPAPIGGGINTQQPPPPPVAPAPAPAPPAS